LTSECAILCVFSFYRTMHLWLWWIRTTQVGNLRN